MILPSLGAGRRAERKAARFLAREGLEILAKNVRCGRDEIDLLAREAAVVVVVEVRARQAGVIAADLSVTPGKARRLERAWAHLRRRLRLPVGTPVRFDLVLLGPEGAPVHLRGALNLQEGGIR